MTTVAIDENTSGRDDARRALMESRQSARRADTLVNKSASILDVLRGAHLGQDNFADKLRETMRGN